MICDFEMNWYWDQKFLSMKTFQCLLWMVNEIPFTCLPFAELFNIGSAFLWTLKENLSILLYAVWPWFLCAVRMCHIYHRKKIMMEYGKIEQHSILLFLITYNIRILNSAINIWYLEKTFLCLQFRSIWDREKFISS